MPRQKITAEQQRDNNSKRDAQVSLSLSSETEILVKTLKAVTLEDVGEAFAGDVEKAADAYTEIRGLDGLSSVLQSNLIVHNKDLCYLAKFKLEKMAALLAVLS